jgi:predicted MFS family arabinose efflux permease
MLTMVAFGVGEILGCFFIGWIVDRFGSKVAVIVNLIVITIMTGLTLGWLAQFDYTFLTFAMTFSWGF